MAHCESGDAHSETNQPTKKPTKDRVLCEVQDDIPCSVKTFLHMKCIAEIGEQCLMNYNWPMAIQIDLGNAGMC
jgi:hypothetical protein